ncbi:MAG: HAMP domain-containing histidine kinase [Deltaproteobacteria bacterium]|nr:HAMP domain-containing histidine kinase [Deltaproteobacteria bacterium]
MSTPPRHVSRRRQVHNILIPASFGARFALGMSLLIAVVCVGQCWILVERDLTHGRQYLEERGRTLSQYVARDAELNVLSGNHEALAQLGDKARSQNDVVYCRFVDGEGHLLASNTGAPGDPGMRGDRTRIAPPGSLDGDLWEFTVPILTTAARPQREEIALFDGDVRSESADREQSIGAVTLGMSLAPLHALRAQTLTTAIAVTTFLTALAVLTAVFMAGAFTRPLHELATAADAIAQGDLDAQVGVRGEDEVGMLASSFNAMVGSLSRSRASLEEKVLELQEANRLKSEFLATVSHELRTPLNVIIGYVEMLAEGSGGRVTDAQRELLDIIRQYSTLQLGLIENVLDFSRLSSGKVSYRIERFHLEPLLGEVHQLHAGRLPHADVHLTVAIVSDVPELETDRVKLHEIIRNLLDNAVKFTEKGAITVEARATPDLATVVIEVRDTGRGISEEELRYIFDAFRQVGESATRGTGGVGLGLSIAKQLADALGGTISVESRVGEGSTFRLKIPSRLRLDGGSDGEVPADATGASPFDDRAMPKVAAR